MNGPRLQHRWRARARGLTAAPWRLNAAPVRRLGFSFVAEPARVALARRRLAALLYSVWGDIPAVDDATLVASELLTNGCLYGGGRVRVHARINRRSFSLKVSTSAAWRDQRVSTCTTEDEGGRGLEIVRALAQSVLIEPEVDGSGVSVTAVCLAEQAHTPSAERGLDARAA